MGHGLVRGLRARRPWAFIPCLLALGAAYADTIYKTVDAQGHVVYSDHPLNNVSQKVTPEIDRPDPADVARQARQQAALAADDAERSHRVEQQQKQAATDAQKQREREQRCTSARNQYGQFKNGGRLYHYDAQGNRVYYSDAEMAAEAAAAKKVMDEVCGR